MAQAYRLSGSTIILISGHLVTDFLTGSRNLNTYAKDIQKRRKEYNGFNLVLFDIGYVDV